MIDEATARATAEARIASWRPTAQAVGESPLVVDKATGELHVYESGPEQYAAFKEWLDE